MKKESVMKARGRQVMELSRVKFLTITSLAAALTYVFTAFVNLRLPIAANGGLIHLGNVPLFLFAILFGKKTGAFAGGVGMALFDLLSGWTVWAPFTLVIAGLMGYCAGAVTEKKKSFVRYGVAMFLALLIKIAGYYIAEGLIYGNWAAPAASIPGNLIQVAAAVVIVMIVIVPLQKAAGQILDGKSW